MKPESKPGLAEGHSATGEYAGIKEFPKPDAYEQKAPEKVLRKRQEFYRLIKDSYESLEVYYPGSGADPIPREVFGDRVVYGSLREAPYFQWLKDPSKGEPPEYREELARIGPQESLRAVYADVLNPPFSNQSFDLIIVRGLPRWVAEDKGLTAPIHRLLREGGLLVIEDKMDLRQQHQLVERFLKIGFRTHSLDRHGGLTNIHYADLSVEEEGVRSRVHISRDEFVRQLREGKDVVMKAHEIRVLTKR